MAVACVPDLGLLSCGTRAGKLDMRYFQQDILRLDKYDNSCVRNIRKPPRHNALGIL